MKEPNPTSFRISPVSPPGEWSTLSDQNILAKALKERWPIPQKMRKQVLEGIKAVLDLPNGTNGSIEATTKLKMIAVRNLALLDRLNVDILKLVIPRQVIHHKASDLTDEELDQAILDKAEVIKLERDKKMMRDAEFQLVTSNHE